MRPSTCSERRWGGPSHRLPWDITPSPAPVGSSSPRDAQPHGSCSWAKEGGKGPRAASPVFPWAGGLVQELGTDPQAFGALAAPGASFGSRSIAPAPGFAPAAHRENAAAPTMAPACPAASVTHLPCSTNEPALQSSSPR